MGAAVCKRRREDAAREPSAQAGSDPATVFECGKPFCILEACAPSECPSDATTADQSGHSWVFAVDQRDVSALGQANLTLLDCRNADRSALHACVDAGWAAGVRCLLRRRADPSQADNQGHAPLHAAAKLGRRDLVQLLVDAAADVNARDRDMDDGEEFRGGVFEKKTENRTALHYAAEALDHEVCSLLLAHGARVDERDCWYKTPLHLVEDEPADEDQLRLVDLLLRHKADPNLGNVERGANQTSLLTAVYENNLPLVELLVRSGADLSASGKQGMGVLHLAARMRNQRLAAVLLEGGADPAQKTTTGFTAADLARSNGCLELAALLEGQRTDPAEIGGGSTQMDELS